MPHCQECKHYKPTNDGPYCFKSSGHPKPISPIMVKDCFEERPAGEPGEHGACGEARVRSKDEGLRQVRPRASAASVQHEPPDEGRPPERV